MAAEVKRDRAVSDRQLSRPFLLSSLRKCMVTNYVYFIAIFWASVFVFAFGVRCVIYFRNKILSALAFTEFLLRDTF